ncbi:MAG: hypothetical protein AB1665_07160 [Candidatus Thermoplasmatota archaeon]
MIEDRGFFVMDVEAIKAFQGELAGLMGLELTKIMTVKIMFNHGV